MYAMQYEITLPANYDMTFIRQRVAENGHILDTFPGLGLKAYLIRERGRDGSTVNQYAPFYLWASTDGMNRFLWGGGGFRRIIDSFGRPAAQHWTGVAVEQGPARDRTPTAATRATESIPPEVDPAEVVERELAALRERSRLHGLHSAALAIDPARWQLVRFALWEHISPEAADTIYEVLHTSSPQWDELAGTNRIRWQYAT